MTGLITVVFGGPSPEHDISILTGLQCERILTDAGRECQSLYWARTGDFLVVPTGLEAKDFVEGPPKQAKAVTLELGASPGFSTRKSLRSVPFDVGTVLNCCHGGVGEAGVFNGILEMCGISATGGPSWAGSLGMDKLSFGAFVQSLGIPSLPRVALSATSTAPDFEAPYIVKPRFGGSSLGIEVVNDFETAVALASSSPALRGGAVLEPFNGEAIDLNIALRTSPVLECSLLERPLRGGERFYGYEEKYLQGTGLASAPRELPAKVPDDITEQANEWAMSLARAGGFRGVARVDFLYADEKLYLNEINTIPGAMALYLWPASVSNEELLVGMVEEAERTRPAPALMLGHQGSALRVAGGIAQKLSRGTTR